MCVGDQEAPRIWNVALVLASHEGMCGLISRRGATVGLSMYHTTWGNIRIRVCTAQLLVFLFTPFWSLVGPLMIGKISTEVCTESLGRLRTVNGKYLVTLGSGMTICAVKWRFSRQSQP